MTPSKDYDNAVDNVLTSFELLFSLVSSSRVRRTLQGQHDRVLEAREDRDRGLGAAPNNSLNEPTYVSTTLAHINELEARAKRESELVARRTEQLRLLSLALSRDGVALEATPDVYGYTPALPLALALRAAVYVVKTGVHALQHPTAQLVRSVEKHCRDCRGCIQEARNVRAQVHELVHVLDAAAAAVNDIREPLPQHTPPPPPRSPEGIDPTRG